METRRVYEVTLWTYNGNAVTENCSQEELELSEPELVRKFESYKDARKFASSNKFALADLKTFIEQREEYVPYDWEILSYTERSLYQDGEIEI